MRELKHLDLESRKGKAPGGYNCPLAETGAPFIFMNAAGTLDEFPVEPDDAGAAADTGGTEGTPAAALIVPGAEERTGATAGRLKPLSAAEAACEPAGCVGSFLPIKLCILSKDLIATTDTAATGLLSVGAPASAENAGLTRSNRILTSLN